MASGIGIGGGGARLIVKRAASSRLAKSARKQLASARTARAHGSANIGWTGGNKATSVRRRYIHVCNRISAA